MALLSFTATAALSADLPPRLPSPRAPAFVPFFSWNGPYVGINFGYGFGSSTWTDTVTSATTGSFKTNGMLAGATLGYNWQTLGSVIFGLEGDIAWSGIKGTTTVNCPGGCETSNNWLGTTRARLGYAWDRLMPYITGGAAYGNIKISNAGTSATKTTVGWTVGAGLEYAVQNQWTVKLEYLYVDFGNLTCDAACSGGNPIGVKFNTSIVRGGINYRF